MLNSPQFIIAIARFTKLSHNDWNSQRTAAEQRSFVEAQAIAANLTTKELLTQKRAAADYRIQGKNHFTAGRFEEASRSFGRAFIRDPSDPQTIKSLADTTYRYWRKTQDKETLLVLTQFAEIILLLNPEDQQGLSLQQVSLEKRKQQSRSVNISIFVVGFAVILLYFFGWGYINQTSSPSSSASSKPQSQASRISKTINTITPNPTLKLGKGAPSGLKLKDLGSKYYYYAQERGYAYHLQVEVHNNSTLRIDKLDAVLSLKNQQGNRITKKSIDLLPLHQSPMLPGDIIDFSLLLRKQIVAANFTHPTLAQIDITSITSAKIDDASPQAAPIQLQWEVEKPQSIELSAKIREEGYKKEILSGFWARHKIELHNTGDQEVQDIILRLDYLDKKGKPISQDEQAVITTRESALPTGQYRVITFSQELLDKPAAIALSVIHIK